MNDFYVYKHVTLDTNETFYIGKGHNKRAYEKRSRNRLWTNISEKHGFRVEFIAVNLIEKDALDLEIEQIAILKPRANLTKGGQGTSGYKFDSELVKLRNLANKNRYADEQWVARRNKSLKEAMSNPEIRDKLVKFQELKRQQVAAGTRPKHVGPKFSDEVKRRLSEGQKGEKGYWFGRTTAVARPVSNLSNGREFESLSAAAKSVNGSYRSLLRAIKAGKPFKGFVFKYKD